MSGPYGYRTWTGASWNRDSSYVLTDEGRIMFGFRQFSREQAKEMSAALNKAYDEGFRLGLLASDLADMTRPRRQR